MRSASRTSQFFSIRMTAIPREGTWSRPDLGEAIPTIC